MILKMFSVHDSKAELYSPPSCYRARGLAVRHFAELCNQAESPYAKTPEDFHLWEIGLYDDNSAQVEIHRTPVNLGCASDFANGKISMPRPSIEENTSEARIN